MNENFFINILKIIDRFCYMIYFMMIKYKLNKMLRCRVKYVKNNNIIFFLINSKNSYEFISLLLLTIYIIQRINYIN